MQDVHQLASEARDATTLLHQADDYFVGKREAAKEADSLTELDADHSASQLQGQYLPSDGGYGIGQPSFPAGNESPCWLSGSEAEKDHLCPPVRPLRS